MKVRWSQRCAGGCGRWLVVGVSAVKAHRGYWCSSCWAEHRADCERHKVVCAEPQPSDPALW